MLRRTFELSQTLRGSLAIMLVQPVQVSVGKRTLAFAIHRLRLDVPLDSTCPLQESPGPFGPEIPEESPKESPGAFRPRGPKSVRNSLKRARQALVRGGRRPKTCPLLPYAGLWVADPHRLCKCLVHMLVG